LLFFESNFTEGSIQIDPLAVPYLKGSGELSILTDPFYSWPYAGYALIKADPNVPNYVSQRAAFNVYVGEPAKANLHARAYFMRTTDLPLDTDYMMAGQDNIGGANNWNWATLMNLNGACSLRLHQHEGVDPPKHDYNLLLAFNDAGTIKFLNSHFAWDNWPVGVWKCIEVHWIRDAVNGGAEVFFNGVKVHEEWGYDTANLPGRDPGDYGGVRYVHFGALTATQRYKDFGVVIDNIKIADTFTGTEPPTPPPPPQVLLNYTSTPIEIEAVINGVLIPSGSSLEFDQDSVITISVPKEVET